MAGAEQCGFKGQSRSQEGEQGSVKSEVGWVQAQESSTTQPKASVWET